MSSKLVLELLLCLSCMLLLQKALWTNSLVNQLAHSSLGFGSKILYVSGLRYPSTRSTTRPTPSTPCYSLSINAHSPFTVSCWVWVGCFYSSFSFWFSLAHRVGRLWQCLAFCDILTLTFSSFSSRGRRLALRAASTTRASRISRFGFVYFTFLRLLCYTFEACILMTAVEARSQPSSCWLPSTRCGR